MVFALAGDSTTTSAFAISSLNFHAVFLSTLARTVNPDESPAANPRNRSFQLELEQTRQQSRRTQARSLGQRVEIARFSGRQTRKNRVGARRGRVGAAPPGRRTDLELLKDIVRGLHDLCTVPQQRVRAAVAAA